MHIIPTELPDLLVLRLDAHGDERGFFMETWRAAWGEKIKLARPFIQDNHVRSKDKGLVRGLHFQSPPAAQAKLVWVTRGAAYDVALDLRKGSPTYGKHHGIILSEENRLRFFLPRGFAHGYMTLEPGTEFQYKVDACYSAAHEGGVRWNDPALAIPWPALEPTLSARDAGLSLFSSLDSPFFHGK